MNKTAWLIMYCLFYSHFNRAIFILGILRQDITIEIVLLSSFLKF